MNVSVFGLGYVGSVSAACFAQDGHSVVGVDVNPDKVASLNDGRSPIVEKGLDELIRENASNGRLRATVDTKEAVDATSLSLICVGTPSRKNGSLDLTYLERVCEQIGDALATKDSYHVVVVRSTVLPGTTHGVVIPALERTSGKKYGSGFGVTVNPEFLREGTAINDFRHPPMTLVGHNYTSDAQPTQALYAKVEADMVTTSIRTAEMIKYASNTWHALKVCFANEVGNLCKRLEIDSHEVMDIFCRDQKLNLSSYYMKPGFAFGGSCLPKDVRAMQYRAKEVDLDMPVIQAILGSNHLQIQHALEMIGDTGRKRIGLLGFSFKAGTDDLRESPIVILAEALLGKGYQLCIYDRNVSLARLVGANRDYINKQIPHLSSLLSESIEYVIDNSDVLVVGNGSPEFAEALRRTRPDQTVIDLFRLKGIDRKEIPAQYTGICW
ncbi:MAG TPA: UDP-glucose/GDP-mannose dehydrogenase family protein [Vicinamibacterales bacterium]|nr:UDP-glucose/GDP-mannose dehydrogenase family protein [Vicinamibacterales bacterium]